MLLYCIICYLMIIGSFLADNSTPWYAIVFAPIMIPIAIGFVFFGMEFKFKD